jgi:hypothetical protein
VSYLRAFTAVALLATLAACADQPTEPPVTPEPKPAPIPLALLEVTLTGLNGSDGSFMGSKAITVSGGPDLAMNAVNTGIAIELVSSSSFTEGTRGAGGQRFVSFMYRVKNTTGGPLVNVTMLPVSTASTVAGTPFTQVLLFNGANAAASVAQNIVPTGSVYLGADTRMRSKQPDVLQAFTEAEVAAITPAPEVTGMFPYGFVTSNPSTPNSRTLPNAVNANDWGGLVTFAFRYPLQATNADDPYTVRFYLQVVQDTETRMTESIEERQDTSGVRRARERATALGATMVTVLNGSDAADPFVTDYPGQRQLCSVRTAGTAAVPLKYINNTGAYTELAIYRPGQDPGSCSAYYMTGTARPAHYGMPDTVVVRAMDRYGNVRTTPADTVTLTSTDGTAVMPPTTALVSGTRSLISTYTTYGTSTLRATGRRLRGQTTVLMNGMTRTWTGNVNTDWFTGGDWVQLVQPGVQDSVIIPGDRPNFPLLASNVTSGGITMTAGTTTQPFINLSAFDLTVNGSVEVGTTGFFSGTGRLILAGTASTVGGGLSNFDVRNMRVTGTYSASSNLNVTGGRIVVQGGRLRSTGFRVRVRPS